MARIVDFVHVLEAGGQIRRKTWLHNARIGKASGPLAGLLIALFFDEGPVKHEGEFALSISDLTTEDWEES